VGNDKDAILSHVFGGGENKMMILGQIPLRAMALALTCLVVAAPISVANKLSAYAQARSAIQDTHKIGAVNSPHQYTPLSITFACGVRPYEGYDGRIASIRTEWKCDDGAMVYSVKEDFGSSRGAEVERLARLNAKSPEDKPWRIAQTESVGGITIVELAEPVSFGPNTAASNQWVVMRARGASLFLIYGPDREHVIDYYQSHHERDAKN
jgi:hypothetical protein